MGFTLHPRLMADTLHVGDLPLCRVLLMNDATYPWLVLVPRRSELREIHDLDEADQHMLVGEISLASQKMQQHCQAEKMNVAALGNQVPQLHVHVIARFQDDPAWPGPVWGVMPARPYPDHELQLQLSEFKSLFDL